MSAYRASIIDRDLIESALNIQSIVKSLQGTQ